MSASGGGVQRGLWGAALVVGVIGLVALGAAFWARSARGPLVPEVDPQTAAVLKTMRVPEFSLTDQDGRIVTREALEGRYTVLAFMFTHCALACPTMSANMLSLMEELKGTPARFLSMSVDPEHDTPARVRAYLDDLGADTTRWTYLTGDIDTVRAIATDGMGFLIQDDPGNAVTLEDGRIVTNVLHPSRFILIGPDVSVIGLYDGMSPDETSRLAADLKRIFARRR